MFAGIEPYQASRPTEQIEVLRLGLRPLQDVLLLMEALVEQRHAGKIPDVLLLVRHPGVYTLGRGMQRSLRPIPEFKGESLESYRARLPYPVLEVQRGGDVTFHDPGQVIGYPLVQLDPGAGLGVRDYLDRLQDFLIRVIEQLIPGTVPSKRAAATGIWIGDKKVASLGVAVRHGVTFHGFALNINTDLAAFAAVRPCGLDAHVIANLSDLAGRFISIEEVHGVIETLLTKETFHG